MCVDRWVTCRLWIYLLLQVLRRILIHLAFIYYLHQSCRNFQNGTWNHMIFRFLISKRDGAPGTSIRCPSHDWIHCCWLKANIFDNFGHSIIGKLGLRVEKPTYGNLTIWEYVLPPRVHESTRRYGVEVREYYTGFMYVSWKKLTQLLRKDWQVCWQSLVEADIRGCPICKCNAPTRRTDDHAVQRTKWSAETFGLFKWGKRITMRAFGAPHGQCIPHAPCLTRTFQPVSWPLDPSDRRVIGPPCRSGALTDSTRLSIRDIDQ